MGTQASGYGVEYLTRRSVLQIQVIWPRDNPGPPRDECGFLPLIFWAFDVGDDKRACSSVFERPNISGRGSCLSICDFANQTQGYWDATSVG